MLKPAARSGRLCFGPNRGQSVTFVRPEAWLKSWRAVDPDAGLAEVARRYLRAYGPATAADLTAWTRQLTGVPGPRRQRRITTRVPITSRSHAA